MVGGTREGEKLFHNSLFSYSLEKKSLSDWKSAWLVPILATGGLWADVGRVLP